MRRLRRLRVFFFRKNIVRYSFFTGCQRCSVAMPASMPMHASVWLSLRNSYYLWGAQDFVEDYFTLVCPDRGWNVLDQDLWSWLMVLGLCSKMLDNWRYSKRGHKPMFLEGRAAKLYQQMKSMVENGWMKHGTGRGLLCHRTFHDEDRRLAWTFTETKQQQATTGRMHSSNAKLNEESKSTTIFVAITLSGNPEFIKGNCPSSSLTQCPQLANYLCSATHIHPDIQHCCTQPLHAAQRCLPRNAATGWLSSATAAFAGCILYKLERNRMGRDCLENHALTKQRPKKLL